MGSYENLCSKKVAFEAFIAIGMRPKQVDGFSGAEYKSFENITDAIDYLGWQEKSHEETINRKDDTLENASKNKA